MVWDGMDGGIDGGREGGVSAGCMLYTPYMCASTEVSHRAGDAYEIQSTYAVNLQKQRGNQLPLCECLRIRYCMARSEGEDGNGEIHGLS